jgi:hypothetical protein
MKNNRFSMGNSRSGIQFSARSHCDTTRPTSHRGGPCLLKYVSRFHAPIASHKESAPRKEGDPAGRATPRDQWRGWSMKRADSSARLTPAQPYIGRAAIVDDPRFKPSSQARLCDHPAIGSTFSNVMFRVDTAVKSANREEQPVNRVGSRATGRATVHRIGSVLTGDIVRRSAHYDHVAQIVEADTRDVRFCFGLVKAPFARSSVAVCTTHSTRIFWRRR